MTVHPRSLSHGTQLLPVFLVVHQDGHEEIIRYTRSDESIKDKLAERGVDILDVLVERIE